jgi:Na+-transporting methylmalonyl-CoA/oxaloacetate decarboxylase gamma subunit
VVALSLLQALAAILVVMAGFAVVIAVCFVLLRLISFVTSGEDSRGDEPRGEPPGDRPPEA